MTPARQSGPHEGDRPEARPTAKPFEIGQPIAQRRLDPDYYARLIETYRPLLDMDRRRREAARRVPPMSDGRRDRLAPRTWGAA